MLIDSVYRTVQAIANKDQRGNFTPAQFNVFAESAQREFISRRMGNLPAIGRDGVPGTGYESTWRIHEDLRPFISGPEAISISNPSGLFNYPYGYIWPDAVHKDDFTPIKRITADQYPHIKRSRVIPPRPDYPVIVFGNPYGFIDPYSIGSFQMSYLKMPPSPVWGYGMVSDEPVFDENISVDFKVPPSSANELIMIILAHLGINLSAADLSQYGLVKQQAGV